MKTLSYSKKSKVIKSKGIDLALYKLGIKTQVLVKKSA